MHMSDALVTPAVGGAMWAATSGIMAVAAARLRSDQDDRRVPLMGVLGAFVFCAQMINFAIPGTGSSGHLGGGLLLAILLGPHGGFITIASVLLVQSLFFADGGLLALGCNIINIGFFPCYLAYPLVYRRIAGTDGRRVMGAALIAAVVGLQLGSLGVVIQTALSGIAELSLTSFLLVMQPIHLAIGLGEGLATAAVVLFLLRARPEVLSGPTAQNARGSMGLLAGFLAAALIVGGVFSWFASGDPDGLEWAQERAGESAELEAPQDGLHAALAELQDRTAVMPDYAFQEDESLSETAPGSATPEEDAWPAVEGQTSLAGVVGGVLCLFVVGALGFLVQLLRKD